jgi:hypothetical protein
MLDARGVERLFRKQPKRMEWSECPRLRAGKEVRIGCQRQQSGQCLLAAGADLFDLVIGRA